MFLPRIVYFPSLATGWIQDDTLLCSSESSSEGHWKRGYMYAFHWKKKWHTTTESQSAQHHAVPDPPAAKLHALHSVLPGLRFYLRFFWLHGSLCDVGLDMIKSTPLRCRHQCICPVHHKVRLQHCIAEFQKCQKRWCSISLSLCRAAGTQVKTVSIILPLVLGQRGCALLSRDDQRLARVVLCVSGFVIVMASEWSNL